MDQNLQNELALWIPRLSGAAFKCLFCIYLELAAAGAAEVVIPRNQFIRQTGLAKSTILDAVGELLALKATARRPTKGGAFAYHVPGREFGSPENRASRKSNPNENRQPADIFDLFLLRWTKYFPGKIPEVAAETRAAITAELQVFNYKYLLRSLKGLAQTGDATLIEQVLKPETTVKIVRRGNFLYFNWRDSRAGGDADTSPEKI